MTSTRALEEKTKQHGIARSNHIETNLADESKEEKPLALVASKKYKASATDKLFVQSIAISLLLCSEDPKGKLIPWYIIPNSIWLTHIIPFLVFDFNTCSSLAHVNRPISLFFRKHLEDIRLEQLLQHIAYAEKTQAEKIIQSNPKLLLLSGPIVKDHAGREIQQTAYQMALAAGDVFVQFKKGKYQPDAQGEEMKEMIEKYLIELLGEEEGVAEIERQGKMVWPDGFEERFKQKQAEDKKAVTEIFAAIGKVDGNADEARLLKECGEALEKFKTHLEPKGIITTGTPGYHFDPQILVEAYGLYDVNYANFGNDWSPKNLFVWQKVIGLIQRYLTVCDAMVLCQGSYYLVRDGEKFRRSLKFRFGDGDGVYFPLDSDPAWSLGKNCAHYGADRHGYSNGARLVACRVWLGGVWKSYVEQKHRRCESLCATPAACHPSRYIAPVSAHPAHKHHR